MGDSTPPISASSLRELRDGLRSEAVRRYASGESANAIAAALGVSPQSVCNWVRAAGETIRHRAAPSPNRKRAGRTPAERRAEAVQRYLSGESSASVTRRFDVTSWTVVKWVKDAGLTPRAPGRGKEPAIRVAAPAPPSRLPVAAPARRPALPEPGLDLELEPGGEVVLRAVDDGLGNVVLIATARTNIGGDIETSQVSLDPRASTTWPRALLNLLDRSRRAEAVARKEGVR